MSKEEKYIFFVNEQDKLDTNPNLNKHIELNEKQAEDVAKKGMEKFKVIEGILAEKVNSKVYENYEI